MDLFDLHCDTVSECLQTGQSLTKNELAVDLQRGKIFQRWIQTFAFWIPDTLHGEQAYDCFLQQYNFWETQRVPYYHGELTQGCQAILMVEGGSALAGKLESIRELQERNIRMLTLTWNGENEIASGANAVGGLKAFGKRAVAELEHAGILVDVSHLNEESFWDTLRVATRPLLATHSNAFAVCPHPRNLKDSQIAEIKNMNGLIGLNFYHEFLKPQCQNGMDALREHIDHFLRLGCENHLAIGSDFDGAQTPKDLHDIASLKNLCARLKEWYGAEQAEKILFWNAVSFFDKNVFRAGV